MTHPLAVLLPQPGAVSETFIRRHLEELLPGETVMLTERLPDKAAWSFQGPTLLLQSKRYGLPARVLHRFHLGEHPAAGALRRFLRSHQTTVVLGEYLDYSHRWLKTLSPKVRFFAHAHGYDVSRLLKLPEWRQKYLDFRKAAGIITMSELNKRELVEIGLPPSLIHVIPYGVDVTETEPTRFSINSSEIARPIRLLAVGRMVAKKAPLLLLQSVLEARQVLGSGALRLEYIGDGPFFEAANNLVRQSGGTDDIILHGAKPNSFVQELMQQADVFVQHSRTDPETGDREGMPVAILEAMAAGLPVVSTMHAGIPESVLHGKTGLLSPEGDAEAFTRSLLELIQIEKPQRLAMGLAGWQRAKAEFSWRVERQRLLELMGLTTQ
jgi:colanic acid/amylovoran biosynthesis glycosyltransferase